MYEAVDGSECHCRIRKDFVPFTKGLVCGDHDGSLLIACGDEFEEPPSLQRAKAKKEK